MGKRMVRNYKDTLFRMIFNDKKELLSLYNAINGTDYEDEGKLEITTLDNAVYMNMKNDISFVCNFNLNLYEHQATLNPNMPLRNLFYISRQLEALIDDKTIYSSKLIKIPNPKFIVFYNGTDCQPESSILRLSDAYIKENDEPALELSVTMLNINKGHNSELMDKCKTLNDYSTYVDMVRRYSKTMDIELAVSTAVDECLKNDILYDFLSKYKSEAIQVSIFEYDEEKVLKIIGREKYEDGVEDGKIIGFKDGKTVGFKSGNNSGHIDSIIALSCKNYTSEEIADLLDMDVSYVQTVIGLITKYPNETSMEIAERMLDNVTVQN